MQELVVIVLSVLLVFAGAYIYHLKKNPVVYNELEAVAKEKINNEVKDAPPVSGNQDIRNKYQEDVLPKKGVPGRRGEWLRPVSLFDDKGVYTAYDLFPEPSFNDHRSFRREEYKEFLNSVYLLDLSWVNSVATTSYKNFKDKDVDNATVVVLCDNVDINIDKFRLLVKEPHGKFWTEFIDIEYRNKDGKRLSDDMDLYTKKTLIIDGYVREGKFFVTDITPMVLNKNIYHRE